MIESLAITTCLAENSEPLCRALAKLIYDELALPCRFVNDIPWPERARRLAQGDIQLGWICGLLFIQLRREQNSPLQLLAAPVMAGADYANRPVYFSRLVVRQESPFTTFSELRGLRLGFNEPGSFSGFAIMRRHLKQLGKTNHYFGEWIETGSNYNSLRLLLDGRIDATALDSTFLDYQLRLEPELGNKIRVIANLGPNPSPPLVISTFLPAKLREELQQMLLILDQMAAGQAMLTANGIKRFVVVGEGDYHSLYEISHNLRP